VPVSDERDAEQRVADADELVADRGAVGQLRHDLADAEADGEGGQRAPPPGEVRALARQPGAARGVDDILEPLALHNERA
jgi:hypothetical protein